MVEWGQIYKFTRQKNKKDIQETQMPFYDENTLTYDESPPQRDVKSYPLYIKYVIEA